MSPNKSKLDNCGCCEGIELLTPAAIDNDHGLASLLYRIGTHGKFKESMLRGLSDSAVLKELTTRENDDSTIALFDVWAMILDVLTFYNERIINEGYLLTSKERLSLVELAKHINYIPKPGVAAGSWFSFLMSESPGAPTETIVAVGTRVQSIPGQDEKAQIFENIEEILAQTKWNNIQSKLTETQSFVKGLTSLYIRGTDAQLKTGDKILLVGSHRLNNPGSERWDSRTLEQVIVNSDENYTQLIWREGLGHNNPNTHPADDTRVFVFRQQAALFGYNAPDYKTMSKEVKESFNGTGWSSDEEWDDFAIPFISYQTIYLDAYYPKILADSWLILTQPNHTELYKANQVTASAQNNFALTSKSSKIVLDSNENLNQFNRRETVIWAQGEELTLTDAPILQPIFGNTIELNQAYPDLIIDDKLIISGEAVTQIQVSSRELIMKSGKTEIEQYNELLFIPNGSTFGIPLATDTILEIIATPELIDGKTKWPVNHNGTDGYVTCSDPTDLIPYIEDSDSSVVEIPSSLNEPVIVSELIEIAEQNPDKLILKESLKHVYHISTVTINANIAQATHGETNTEILGSGNAAIPFQKFSLKQNPLTYISSSSSSGIATTLEVRVDDIKWEEVTTFYNRTSEERIYISRNEDDGTTYVQFGNGITGARLPSGVDNIVATYRVGIGMEGLLNANQLSLLLDTPLGVESVINPLPTSGAEDPESPENIAVNAPLTVLTLDRIVSIEDFENFARAFAGIGKARADLLWKGEDRTIHLTLASSDEASVDSTLEENLINAIDNARHNNYPVLINSFEEKLFNVKATIKLDPDYLLDEVVIQIKEALIATYNFESRGFGQDVTPSELIAIIQSVEGVVAVDLNKIGNQDPFSTEHFRLTSDIAQWDSGLIKPAQLLLIDQDNIVITLMPS